MYTVEVEFAQAISILNKLLRKKQPRSFSSTWILRHSPAVYRFIRVNVRTELNTIDWDVVTMALAPGLQRKWLFGCKPLKRRQYWNAAEVEIVLSKYKDKLYTFVTPLNKEDERIRGVITIALVRLAQRGNVAAQHQTMSLVRYVIDEWIEQYPTIAVWQGYDQLIQEEIEACIRRYRYSGSFIRYLFRTLEFAGYGVQPLLSLDDYWPTTEVQRMESVIQDPETKEIRMFIRT